ncbi:hypothetical protein [Bacillus phage PK1]|nr:hypothetical protein [Bacillus phage PK1]
MAKFRQVHVEFWQDGFVLDLTPEEKYFYLYLMTNSKTSQCGIYELPKRIIETETGYNRETVEKLLQRFIDYDKIAYSDRTKEIMIKNWINYNFINSPKVINCIEKELDKVKEIGFANHYRMMAKRLGYGINTVCIDLGEEEEKEKEEEEKNNIPFAEIVTYLNDTANTSYRSSSKKTQQLINARVNEGFSLEDFKAVIQKKTAEWLHDKEMSKYLRPETLFGTKFEGYLNQPGGVSPGKNSNAADQQSLLNEYQGLNF